jgi:nondiscriminating glutamyl-tRNA synthetase
MIRTRFAPSPTGFLHVGGLRTALYAYLFAKQNGGQFLLRIEDTDRERLVEGAIEDIVSSLNWAGIDIDEGVMLDGDGAVTQKGDRGPYIQSERLDMYKKHIQTLLDAGHAYHCFCTKERLDEVRTIQQAQKQPTGYDGHCRNLTADEVRQQIESGITHVIRLKMPKTGTTTFVDKVRGEVSFENALVDDQVLIKTDGFPTYHFAVVVDDHEMEITHVIRGEEWISSTPKHIMLYSMFGWQPPEFAHLSLFVNADKQKMSKRHGDVSVGDFKSKGYLAEALVNFIAFLGWNPGDDREIFTKEDLVREFLFDRVQKTAAVFNVEKLDWYNKEWMKRLSLEELAERTTQFIGETSQVRSGEPTKLQNAIAIERDRAATLKELIENIEFLFATELQYDGALLVWKKSTAEDAKQKLTDIAQKLTEITENDWTKETIEKTIGDWIETNAFGRGDVLWPLRVSLSGKQNSPGPFEIASVLGKEQTLARITHAISLL